MAASETESVRVDKEVMELVREVIKKTGQTIGGFISVEVRKVAERKLKIKQ